MVLSVPGVDYESLDHAEQEYAVKRFEAALKAFGPGFHVYQYLFKSNRPDIPFASYDDPVVEAAIDQRRRVLRGKARPSLSDRNLLCIVLEGPRSKSGVGAAFAQLFRDPAGAIGELRTQFTNNSMKMLLRSQIETRPGAARTEGAGIRPPACRLHADRGFESAGPVPILPPAAQLRRVAHRREAEVHAVSRLSGGQFQY